MIIRYCTLSSKMRLIRISRRFCVGHHGELELVPSEIIADIDSLSDVAISPTFSTGTRCQSPVASCCSH